MPTDYHALDEASWFDPPKYLVIAMLLGGSSVWALAIYGLVKLLGG